MKLILVEVQGYRRFEQKSKMILDGKLIAIVGPNEAGKSSFLKALMHLNSNNAFAATGAAQELTRGANISPEQVIVRAGYLLDESDRQTIAHIRGGGDVRWLIVSKKAKGGNFVVEITPKPTRDLQFRQKIVNMLRQVDFTNQVFGTLTVEEATTTRDDLEKLARMLDVYSETLPNSVIQEVWRIAGFLGKVPVGSALQDLRDLSFQLENLAKHEEEKHPETIIINTLSKRRPTFLLFTEENRSLQSEYDLNEAASKPPVALDNLARLAQLNLSELFKAIREQDHGAVESIIERSNQNLQTNFEKSWSQSGITVRLRADQTILRILVGGSPEIKGTQPFYSFLYAREYCR